MTPFPSRLVAALAVRAGLTALAKKPPFFGHRYPGRDVTGSRKNRLRPVTTNLHRTLNGDGVKQSGDAGLEGWTVFLDADNDTILDAGEISTVTGINGEYEFTTGVAPPRVNVALILQVDDPLRAPGRWVETTPGSWRVAIPDNSTTGIADFGVQYHAFGAIVPIGGETLANATTAGAQTVLAVAADSQGNYVILWRQDSSLIVRLFNADGTAASGEIVVVTSTALTGPGGHDVAMADNGMFAVVWTEYNSFGTKVAYTRAYSANGTPLTAAPVQVTPNNNKSAFIAQEIAMDADGDYVVMYAGAKLTSVWNQGLVDFQRVNKLGQLVGGNTQVVDRQYLANTSLAMDNSGNFVVVRDDLDNQGSINVYAQRYTSAGKKTGSRITIAANEGLHSSAAMNGSGQFVVTGGFIKVYSATGTLLRVSTGGASGICAIDDAGNVVIMGASTFGQSTTVNESWEVFFRRFTAGGVLESTYVVNPTTEGFQTSSDVAITGADSFVIAWSGYGTGDDEGVFFQRYGPAV